MQPYLKIFLRWYFLWNINISEIWNNILHGKNSGALVGLLFLKYFVSSVECLILMRSGFQGQFHYGPFLLFLSSSFQAICIQNSGTFEKKTLGPKCRKPWSYGVVIDSGWFQPHWRVTVCCVDWRFWAVLKYRNLFNWNSVSQDFVALSPFMQIFKHQMAGVEKQIHHCF